MKQIRKVYAREILLSVFAIIVVVMVLFPIVWMLPAAFKSKQEIWAIPNTFFPKNFTWDNFVKVFTIDLNGYHFVSSVFNTLLVSVLGVAGSLTVNMAAAYVFARLEFRGKQFLWCYFIITMFIPGITILLTSIQVVNFLNMTDTLSVLIIPGIVSGYNIFFFRQFYYGMPESTDEAAIMDGCSKFGIFVRIYIPMSITPMVIIGVSTFMGYWNSFMWPTLTIINNADIAQVMQVIRILNTSYRGEYGVVVAATIVSMSVPFLIYAIFQKKITEGIAISGLK